MTISQAVESVVSQVVQGVDSAARVSGSQVIARVIEFDLAVQPDTEGDLEIDPNSTEASSRVHICLDLVEEPLFPDDEDL
jgi:hypothetical protein